MQRARAFPIVAIGLHVALLMALACGRGSDPPAAPVAKQDRRVPDPVAAAREPAPSTAVAEAPAPGAAAAASQVSRDTPDSDQRDQRDPADSPGPVSGVARADGQGRADRPANLLADQTSPYLLMHADGPVQWYPWCEEALARARQQDKLIFLSIGYSSCHWCHVMQRETFMDAAIATVLNEHFVCIKVDREERPDIDEIYMMSLQIFFQLVHSPQGGGWPLSMFLTPDAEPIMGGTYFPPRAKDGRPGFEEILQRVVELWETQPDQVRAQGQQLAGMVKERMTQRESVDPVSVDAELVDDLTERLAERYDAQYGGFGYSEADPRMPKFPEPSNLVLLLQLARQNDDARAREMLVATLEKMARGGIHDQLGGGFHRYSTDRFWRVPHFEKMLYDNAQLASVYAGTHALTARADFRRVMKRLIEFVLREMTGADGGFYSALDAETDEQEGTYYVWSKDQLKAVLSADEFALVADVFGVGGEPNFNGRYVLQFRESAEPIARRRGVTPEDLLRQVDTILQKLLTVRSQRRRPRTDTKILTAWNGLMIRGMADAGRTLEDCRYLSAAVRAADFVLSRLRTPDGRLLRSYRAGEAKLNGYLDDYAFLVDGLIALHQASGDEQWLDVAAQLTDKQIELFWDEQVGGFFFTSHDHESLIARGKKPTDSGVPSGNSVTVGNLIYLAQALERPEYLPYAEKTVVAALPLFRLVPAAMPRMGAALANYIRIRDAVTPTDNRRPRTDRSEASADILAPKVGAGEAWAERERSPIGD